MKKAIVLMSGLLAASTALGAAMMRVQEPVAPVPVPARAESGLELFVSSGCSHCHTIDGTGGTRGPNLSGIGRRWRNDAIRHQIEQGNLEMPPYKDVLSDLQIETLVAYLHTRRAREPKVKLAPAHPSTEKPVVDPS